jgi:hypothetical protein
MKTIDIEETLISQKGQGISIGHMTTTIVVDKVTSLRPVQLPSSVRCNDGTPALIQGTAISLGGDQILVAKTIDIVKDLLGFKPFTFLKKINTDVQREKMDLVDEDTKIKAAGAWDDAQGGVVGEAVKKIVNVDEEAVDKYIAENDRAEPKIIQFPGKEGVK